MVRISDNFDWKQPRFSTFSTDFLRCWTICLILSSRFPRLTSFLHVRFLRSERQRALRYVPDRWGKTKHAKTQKRPKNHFVLGGFGEVLGAFRVISCCTIMEFVVSNDGLCTKMMKFCKTDDAFCTKKWWFYTDRRGNWNYGRAPGHWSGAASSRCFCRFFVAFLVDFLAISALLLLSLGSFRVENFGLILCVFVFIF